MIIKRCIDIALSVLFLLLASPLLFAAAVAIWLESGSPIIFRQERIGKRFSRFDILKLRSMRAKNTGPLLTVGGDNRVTKVGKVLRLTKIDEIPQFWNVLRGDMSIVGPRPEVPEFVELYRERFQGILENRPGITDIASLHFCNEEAILAKSDDPVRAYREWILPIKLDLSEKYLRERSVLHDIAIMTQTAILILRLRRSSSGTNYPVLNTDVTHNGRRFQQESIPVPSSENEEGQQCIR
jgi:lipopolysaccharide/colanic/teichoic acid biosynthesis glycosyltransferase